MSAQILPSRLIELEAVIEAGIETVIDVGLALEEIKKDKLYKETHRTFESYVDERWGWTREYAYGQIQAARVRCNTGVTSLPVNTARAMAPLPVETQRELAPVVADLSVREAEKVIREAKTTQPKEVRQPNPSVLAALRDLHRYTLSTPQEELIAWDGDWRTLAMQWASVRWYFDSAFKRRGQKVPKVLEGATNASQAG